MTTEPLCKPDEPNHCRFCGSPYMEIKRMAAEIEQLRAGIESVVAIASEAAREWDNDNDARVGKILIALSGRVKGYREDIDAIHALRERS
jgi:hypothetical protein